MKKHTIAVVFYLRLVSRQPGNRSLFVFYNYRQTITGQVLASNRDRAKVLVRERHPAADFWR